MKVLNTAQESKNGKVYTKIQLSIKDVSQDGNKDDLSKKKPDFDATREKIAQNLSSSIGMGVAIDPMANSNRLVLKSDLSGGNSALINGYALVDYDETAPARSDPNPVINGMGRGRSATLPAWMTTKNEPEKKSKSKENKEARKERKQRKREAKAERKHRKERKRKKVKKKDSKHPKRDTIGHRNAREKYRSRKRSRSDSSVDSSQDSLCSGASQSESSGSSNVSGKVHRQISLEIGNKISSKGRGRGMTLPAWMTRNNEPILTPGTAADKNKKYNDYSEGESDHKVAKQGNRKERRYSKYNRVVNGNFAESREGLREVADADKRNRSKAAKFDETEPIFKSLKEAKRLVARLEKKTS